MVRAIVLILMIIMLSLGCRQKTPEPSKSRTAQAPAADTIKQLPTDAIHRSIKRYNLLLAEGYKSLNMNPLQEVATPELAQKAYYHMAALGEGSTRMYSTLKTIEFKNTDLSKPHKCLVSTREVWDFSYVDIKTGTRNDEVKDYVYYVTYKLEDQGGKWILTDINASGEDRKEMPSWKKMVEEKRKRIQ
jgi:hypothetical protein